MGSILLLQYWRTILWRYGVNVVQSGDKIVHDDHWLRPQYRIHICEVARLIDWHDYYYYYYYYHHHHYYYYSKIEEIKQIIIKKINSIGVLRKACGVVIGVAERILKMTTLKRWIATEMRWNRNEVSRGSSMTREIRWWTLKSNDIDRVHCLEC